MSFQYQTSGANKFSTQRVKSASSLRADALQAENEKLKAAF